MRLAPKAVRLVLSDRPPLGQVRGVDPSDRVEGHSSVDQSH